MKKIKLTQGKFALVDNEDFEGLNKHKWYCSDRGYAVRIVYAENGKRFAEFMHRVINQTPIGLETDHVDRNRLNNRRSNLRTCTSSQNGMNTVTRNRTGAKGVHVLAIKVKSGIRQYIRAQIKLNGRTVHLGCFKTIAEASDAYDRAANKYYGEFARPNNTSLTI